MGIVLDMVEAEVRDNAPKKRNLITKGELPESAGGGKSTIKEKIIFSAIMAAVLIVVLIIII